MALIRPKRGVGPPIALAEDEIAIDKTPGAEKFWVGINGVPTQVPPPSVVPSMAKIFAFAFQQDVPANAPIGTTYTFTVPAADMPAGDYYWAIDFENAGGNAYNCIGCFALNGLEGFWPGPGFPPTFNATAYLMADWNDGLGASWRLIGGPAIFSPVAIYLGRAAFNQVGQSGATMPVAFQRHANGDGIQFQLTLNTAPTVASRISFCIQGRVLADMPITRAATSTAPPIAGTLPTLPEVADDVSH